jgi:hypothetical protein
MQQCCTALTACNTKFSYDTNRTAAVLGRRSSPHLNVFGCSVSQLMPSVIIVALKLATANILRTQ